MKNKVLQLITHKEPTFTMPLLCGENLMRTLDFSPSKKDFDFALQNLGTQGKRGFASASKTEAPGRYYPYELVIEHSALELTACGLAFEITALSPMGQQLLNRIHSYLSDDPTLKLNVPQNHHALSGCLIPLPSASNGHQSFHEEDRTKQRSIFTLLRRLQTLLSHQHNGSCAFWGFYGLFGYNLVFQFEKLSQVANKAPSSSEKTIRDPDLHLFLPESLLLYEPQTQTTARLHYQLESEHIHQKKEPPTAIHATKAVQRPSSQPFDFKGCVEEAKKRFAVGDLFEVVPSYEIAMEKEPSTSPLDIYQKLMDTNPSPYCFMVGTGDEHVIGASPEMYLRSDGTNIETCPISGTIVRGKTPLEDEQHIRQLLNSSKDHFELTMCTDVDRNDKSRVCQPGSIVVKGRRLIELYSHLIHTVDWVTGKLRSDCDSLDAFISHMWAVTVTGAPKADAIQWIEHHEATPRRWYGGAVGFLGVDGTLDTGLIIRTLCCQAHQITTRVGATLLHHSNANEEDLETKIKAAAMIQAVQLVQSKQSPKNPHLTGQMLPTCSLKFTPRVLMIDHRDSFVHTLSDYFRQCGAELSTLRYKEAHHHLRLHAADYDLVVLSPGPGSPEDFKIHETLDLCNMTQTPVFGVCLGLQAIVSYFGGALSTLAMPLHGEPSIIAVQPMSKLFNGLPAQMTVGRYHSLYASKLPSCLKVTATDSYGVPMAVEHNTLNISAVQFHPESLMTDAKQGLRIIKNVLDTLVHP